MSQPIASWIERFASRVILLRPGVPPLEAVRHATKAWNSTSELPPEKAAEVFLTTHEPPEPRLKH